jgi:hypothetical protein
MTYSSKSPISNVARLRLHDTYLLLSRPGLALLTQQIVQKVLHLLLSNFVVWRVVSD